MLLVSGTLLVLATWIACVVCLVGLGLFPAVLASTGPVGWREIRSAMWWGLLIVTVFAYVANLFLPLGGSIGLALALVGFLSIAGIILVRRRGFLGVWAPSRAMVVLWVVMGLAAVYLAAAALGPVTNYDSGLYHLGAIRYASEFATIPGLANLYFPFGYGNAEFPLAAMLTGGPWGLEGYRLLNGLVMMIVTVDLFIRSGQRRLGPGLFVLAVGVTAAWVPMIALVDYWVTSPTQDSTVLFVSVAAVAYLADGMLGRQGWVGESAAAIALSILLVMLRPTMVPFAVVVIAVVVVRAWRTRGVGSLALRAGALVSILGSAAAVATVLRDYLLSGWLLYPLSILPFAVPWRAADPVFNRTATLGFHRDPDSLWEAAQGWGWIGGWVSRLPSQWETYLLGVGALAAAVLVAVAMRWTGPAGRWRAMALTMCPSIAMVIVWWVATPPSFRFAWGPLFTSVAIPIGWSVWALARTARRAAPRLNVVGVLVIACAVPILLVTAYSAVARFDVGSIREVRTWGPGVPYAVAAPPQPTVAQRELPSGLWVNVPVEGEQCWWAWPMCTPQVEGTVRLRGSGLGDGLLP